LTTLKESLQTGAMQTACRKMPGNLVASSERLRLGRKNGGLSRFIRAPKGSVAPILLPAWISLVPEVVRAEQM
jgi:hypothetical protein